MEETLKKQKFSVYNIIFIIVVIAQIIFLSVSFAAIRSSAERAIKTERKLSVSLFAFNETVVCVNNNKANQKICFI